MGTRAVITFRDEDGSKFHVYKHWDGDPTEIVPAILKTIEKKLAWPLPRFEADEFAAAFIAANKDGSGDIRIAREPEYYGGLAYHYEVYMGKLGGNGAEVLCLNVSDHSEMTFSGALSDFKGG